MWLISVLIQNWRLIFAAALIAGAGLAGYSKGADTTQAKWDKERAAIAQEQLAVALEVQKERTIKQEERNENLAKIDTMRADNAALRKRLRLHKTPCPGSVSAVGENADDATGSGEFFSDISECEEEALRLFDELWDSESIRADRLVEECRATQ